MTNYNTQVCFAVNLAPAEKEWAWDLIRAMEALEENLEEPDASFDPTAVAKAREFLTEYPDGGVGLEVENRENGIVIMHDESANTDHIAWYLQAILSHFDIDLPIMFEWAGTTGRPRLDGYCGGACVVTKDDDFWFIPGQMAADKVAELEYQRQWSEAILYEHRVERGEIMMWKTTEDRTLSQMLIDDAWAEFKDTVPAQLWDILNDQAGDRIQTEIWFEDKDVKVVIFDDAKAPAEVAVEEG